MYVWGKVRRGGGEGERQTEIDRKRRKGQHHYNLLQEPG